MILKEKLALDINSTRILREGIVEMKIFTDGINYIDGIFKNEKHIKKNFKEEIMEKWIKNLRKANSKLILSVMMDYCKQGYKDKAEEIDKIEQFLVKKRSEIANKELKERQQQKLKMKMVERFLEKLYPIPKLADRIVHESRADNYRKRNKGTKLLPGKEKAKFLIPKIDQIGDAGGENQLEKVNKKTGDDPKLLKEFIDNLVIKQFNSRINYHSSSKIQI